MMSLSVMVLPVVGGFAVGGSTGISCRCQRTTQQNGPLLVHTGRLRMFELKNVEPRLARL
jgi:hypothetical protein